MLILKSKRKAYRFVLLSTVLFIYMYVYVMLCAVVLCTRVIHECRKRKVKENELHVWSIDVPTFVVGLINYVI